MDLQKQLESDTALFNRLSPYVWLIEIYQNVGSNKEKIRATLTGFGLYKSNHIVTSYYIDEGPISDVKLQIRARRVSEDDEFKDCVITQQWPRVDLAVLLVGEMVEDNDVLELGDGNLEVGERVFILGNPVGFHNSFLDGEIAFNCRDVEFKSSKETCDHYQNPIAEQRVAEYRIMGNYFNAKLFRDSLNKGFTDFENFKGLHPRMQIVQLNGATVKPGCYGGPLFNNRGQVVGIVFGGITSYPIAIHVSVLKRVESYLIKLLDKQELEKANKKRGMEEGTLKDQTSTPEECRVSKKTKA